MGAMFWSMASPLKPHGYADITGLSQGFHRLELGWSRQSNTRFFGGNADPNRDVLPDAELSSFSFNFEKKFLGVTIAPLNRQQTRG